ncbi:50S ribosomal protein L22, partial [Candidatus Woesearchaeota archaeon CG11_big_fil_rev_8_21_14_0_20_57_5]
METAVARGVDVPVSFKHCVEISNHLRGRSVVSAKRILEEAISMSRAIPFTRFNGDVGHKPGIAAGRYPIKASKAVLALLESAEANAIHKGMNGDALKIVVMVANLAARPHRPGRKRRVQHKRTHLLVEVVEDEEVAAKASKAAPKRDDAKTKKAVVKGGKAAEKNPSVKTPPAKAPAKVVDAVKPAAAEKAEVTEKVGEAEKEKTPVAAKKATKDAKDTTDTTVTTTT